MSNILFPEGSDTLYGRDTVLNQIKALCDQAIDTSQGALVFGVGGTGKTKMLGKLQQMLQDEQRCFLPIYDFHYIDAFAAQAIEDAIVQALELLTDVEAPFKHYKETQLRNGRIRQIGDMFRQAQRQLRQKFIECYNSVAAYERKRGYPIVLLFDTVEQAVSLRDPAEPPPSEGQQEASRGGEFWLQEILPQLQNTIAVISGREQTLYGEEMVLYSRLEATMPLRRIEIGGIDESAAHEFLRFMKQQTIEIAQSSSIREYATGVDLSESMLQTWMLISGGLPFWLSIGFTCEMLAAIPPQLDSLRERLYNGESIALTAEQRLSYQRMVMNYLLHEFDTSQQPLVQVLRWMVAVRKGLTIEILRVLAKAEGALFDVELLWGQLAELLIVKPRWQQLETGQQELQLFLHDEMYFWLDTHSFVAPSQRPSISKTLIAWYDQEIAAAERERRDAAEVMLAPTTLQVELWEARRDASVRRQRQLVLEQLGYYFQVDPELGRHTYNLHAYIAILSREADYESMLWQEMLRNLYYLPEGIPFAVEVESAARWLLRAIHFEDSELSKSILPQLTQYHTRETQGLDFGLLFLTEAQAMLYSGHKLNDENILTLLTQAKQFVSKVSDPTSADVTTGWRDFLLAQIYNWLGYCYRRRYQLYDAIEAYRISLKLVQPESSLPLQLQGQTANNLAYTYSEEGDMIEAHRFGLAGLEINKLFGSTNTVALSYNTLARIELRSGIPQQAYDYVPRALERFEALESKRGKSMCLPTYAEVHRKKAELLDHDAHIQHQTFSMAVDTFHQALALMDEHGIMDVERRCDVYKGLGCTYRSWGQALRRHNQDDPQANAYFKEARTWLEKALETANDMVPPVPMMDIYEDLAAVYVNEAIFDQRFQGYLDIAEALAPEQYKIVPGVGLPNVPRATRSYWRELGQCQLQRMLSSFGKYDLGLSQRASGTEQNSERVEEPAFLEEAATHLLLMFAYLLLYSDHSRALDKAEELAFSQLLSNRTSDQLDIILAATKRVAKDYNLADSPANARTQQLINKAKDDLDLPLGNHGVYP